MKSIWTQSQQKYLDERFEAIDKRFEVIEKRLDAMDRKIDDRFDAIVAILARNGIK